MTAPLTLVPRPQVVRYQDEASPAVLSLSLGGCGDERDKSGTGPVGRAGRQNRER